MKIKQKLFICNVERFVKGAYDGSLAIYGEDGPDDIDGWISLGVIELDVNYPLEDARIKALENLENERKTLLARHQTNLNILENRKRDLLAIEYKGSPPSTSLSEDDIPF